MAGNLRPSPSGQSQLRPDRLPFCRSAAMLRLRWRSTSADPVLNLRIIVERNKLLGSEQVFLELSRLEPLSLHSTRCSQQLDGQPDMLSQGLASLPITTSFPIDPNSEAR